MRPLTRTTLAVGLAGVTVALALGGGGALLRDAAEAAVAGGASYGGGRTEAAVTGPSGTDAAQAALDAPVSAALPASVPAVPARLTLDPPAPAPVPAAPAPAIPVVAATAAPTPPPATPAPPPGTVEAIIVEIFGTTHGQAAIGVARCESGLNPAAVSRGGGNWGLFQINTAHRRRVANMGYQWEDLLDPRVNTLVAHSIFSEQGWRPWGCRHAAH